MLSTGQEGAEELPRVSQPHVCWGLWPRMLEYAGIGWLYSFLSSPSKLQIWKHRVLWKNLVFFFISYVFVDFWVSRYIYIYPPCIAHYKVDILCAYKVGFRSPLYIPTMGDKAVFCARNMPLDLEDDFIATLAFQFIPGWFPTRKRLNICGNAFYRPLVPFKEWP